jgi:hypothetical protein
MKWFHHDTDMHRNRKIRKLIRTHGATGFALWCLLLEKLYAQEGDFSIPADELWFEDVSEDLKLGDYRTPIRILDTLAELHLIDSQLWQEHVIYAPAIAKRGDQYIVKRVQETEKKRKQRAKIKALSLGDIVGTMGQIAVLSPSDPDPDSDPNSDLEIKKDTSSHFEDEINPEPQGEEVEPGEIRPPVNETEKIGEKDSTSKGGSKNRSSAAAPAVRPPSELERFKALYNERRPKAWGAMQQVTTVRKGKWKTLVAEMGGVEEALVALGNALDYCCSDPWWSTKNLTFDNMATNGKIVQLHEKQLSKVSTTQAMPAAYHPPAPTFEYRPVSIEETRAAIAAAKAAVGAKYANSN